MAEDTTHDRLKVGRLIEAYDLEGIGDDLERRWTRSEDRDSLRSLAEYFNRELLATALDRTGTEPLDGEVENLYRLLTDDDVTSGTREQTRARLGQRGLDVESLERDFVSYQAIRSYLQRTRDAEAPTGPRSDEAHRDAKRETVQQLASRLATVAEEALAELRAAGRLTLGDVQVVVSVDAHCTDCGTRAPVPEVIERGGCDCDGETG